MRKKNEINMTEGKLGGKIIKFSIPIMLSGLFQVFYNVADMIVAGKYIGDEALAAIGSTSSLILVIINLFLGLSQGATIVISRHFGAENDEGMEKAAHTTVLLGLIGGIVIGLFGFLICGKLIKLLGTPDNVFELAYAYVSIYFLSMPVIMLYNFTSGIMRSYGDTQRPLYFLVFSGILNIFLNVVFIVCFKMSIEGTAYATLISQAISAFLNLRCLMMVDNACRVKLKKLRLDKNELTDIIKLGIPAGIQSTLFSLANVILQTGINSFGAAVMAAHGAATYVGNILGTVSSGFSGAAAACCSQNVGAKNKKNVMSGWKICLIGVVSVQVVLGVIASVFASQIMSAFSDSAQTVNAGIYRIRIEMLFYFISGAIGIAISGSRSMGHSFIPMVVSVVGTCGLRILWIYTVFEKFHTIECLYMVYPLTWTITLIFQFIVFFANYKKLEL